MQKRIKETRDKIHDNEVAGVYTLSARVLVLKQWIVYSGHSGSWEVCICVRTRMCAKMDVEEMNLCVCVWQPKVNIVCDSQKRMNKWIAWECVCVREKGGGGAGGVCKRELELENYFTRNLGKVKT